MNKRHATGTELQIPAVVSANDVGGIPGGTVINKEFAQVAGRSRKSTRASGHRLR